jgi:hypothetical protein
LPRLWYMATGTPSKDFVHLGEAHRLQFTPQQISCLLEPTRKGLLNREVCCQLPPFQKLGLDILWCDPAQVTEIGAMELGIFCS